MDTEELMRPVRDMAKTAPGSLTHMATTAMFIGFLVWQGGREDVVATQRIKECHSVQERSISAIEKANEINERRVAGDALQTAAFNNFSEVMVDMINELRRRDWPLAGDRHGTATNVVLR